MRRADAALLKYTRAFEIFNGFADCRGHIIASYNL
jgi:hypothetical protein